MPRYAWDNECSPEKDSACAGIIWHSHGDAQTPMCASGINPAPALGWACRSVNVCGRKLWRLLPPEHAPLLLDRFGRDMAPCLPCADTPCDAAAAERFPNLAAAEPHVVTAVQVFTLCCGAGQGWLRLHDAVTLAHAPAFMPSSWVRE